MRLGFRARTCENGGMKRLAKKKRDLFPPVLFPHAVGDRSVQTSKGTWAG